MLEQYLHQGEGYWSWGVERLAAYMSQNTQGTSFVAGLIAAFLIVIVIRSWTHIEEYWKATKIKYSRIERGRLMTTPEQENLEKVLIGDAITDALEDLEYKGKLSRERVTIWYRRFGNLLNLPDLLQKHEALLKAQLRKKHKTGKATVERLPIPDSPTTTKSNGMLARLRSQTT